MKKLVKGDYEDGIRKKGFLCVGDFRKARSMEVREEFFQWLIAVRTVLDTHLSLFLLQAKKPYEGYLYDHLDTARKANFLQPVGQR